MNDTTLNNDAQTDTDGGNQQQTATNAEADKTNAAEEATQQQPTDGSADTNPYADKKAEGDEGADEKQGDEENGKGEDDKAKKESDKDDKKAEAKAPEKYELKLAEGVKLSPDVQGKFESIARELDLSQENAQKLVDLAPEFSKMYASQLISTAIETSNQWAEQTRNDEEIGAAGDKAKLDANLALAAKARDTFASPELVALLNSFHPETNPNGTGLGNHPEVIRLFSRLGRAISEDNKLVRGGAAQGEQSAAERLYSKTSPKK